jgi:hypothetical protein
MPVLEELMTNTGQLATGIYMNTEDGGITDYDEGKFKTVSEACAFHSGRQEAYCSVYQMIDDGHFDCHGNNDDSGRGNSQEDSGLHLV